MPTYTIAQAKARFSELIDRAEAGEEVAITRHGKLVARVSGVERPLKPITAATWEGLPECMSEQAEPAGVFMRRLRDNARY